MLNLSYDVIKKQKEDLHLIQKIYFLLYFLLLIIIASICFFGHFDKFLIANQYNFFLTAFVIGFNCLNLLSSYLHFQYVNKYLFKDMDYKKKIILSIILILFWNAFLFVFGYITTLFLPTLYQGWDILVYFFFIILFGIPLIILIIRKLTLIKKIKQYYLKEYSLDSKIKDSVKRKDLNLILIGYLFLYSLLIISTIFFTLMIEFKDSGTFSWFYYLDVEANLLKAMIYYDLLIIAFSWIYMRYKYLYSSKLFFQNHRLFSSILVSILWIIILILSTLVLILYYMANDYPSVLITILFILLNGAPIVLLLKEKNLLKKNFNNLLT